MNQVMKKEMISSKKEVLPEDNLVKAENPEQEVRENHQQAIREFQEAHLRITLLRTLRRAARKERSELY